MQDMRSVATDGSRCTLSAGSDKSAYTKEKCEHEASQQQPLNTEEENPVACGATKQHKWPRTGI